MQTWVVKFCRHIYSNMWQTLLTLMYQMAIFPLYFFFSETFYRGSGQSTSCIDHVWKFHFWHQKGNACLSPIKPLITALAKLITSSTSALWNWFWMALRRSARKVSVCPFVSFPLIKRLWYYRTHGLSRPINFYFGRQIERITRHRSIHLCTWPLFNIKSAEKQPARLVCASRIGTGCMQQPHYGALIISTQRALFNLNLFDLLERKIHGVDKMGKKWAKRAML